MKLIYFVVLLLFVACDPALSAGTKSETFNIGKPSSSTDKEIKMGAGRLKYDVSEQKMQFSHDGVTYSNVGSGSGSGGSGVNLLENSDFESGTEKWTADSGTFTLASGFFNSLNAFSWNPSASGQTFDSELVTIGEGVAGGLCSIEVKKYKWVGGVDGQIKLIVRHNDVSEATEVDWATLDLSPTLGTETTPAILNFTCPDEPADKLRFRLEAFSDQPAIVGDNTHLGLATNLIKSSDEGGVAFVRFPIVGGCTPLRTNTSFGAFGDDPDCPAPVIEYAYQPVDGSDSNSFDLPFTSLTKGKYTVNVSAPVDMPIGVSGGIRIAADNITQIVPECSFVPPNESGSTVTNGRIWVNCSAFFDNPTTQPVTFSIHGFSASGNILIHGELGSVTWTVNKVSRSTKGVLNFETSGWHVQGKIGGANPALSTSNETTFSNFSSSGLDLVADEKGLPVKIGCSEANPEGSTCSGNETVSYSWNLPQPAKVEACFEYNHLVEVTATSTCMGGAIFRIVETSLDGTQLLQHPTGEKESIVASENGSLTRHVNSHRTCGVFSFESAGVKRIELQKMAQESTGSCLNDQRIRAVRDGYVGTGGSPQISFAAKPIGTKQNGPVFSEITEPLSARVASTSNNEGLERAESSVTCSSTPCSLVRKSNGVKEVTRGGTGSYNLVFHSGTFSSTPTCFRSTGSTLTGKVQGTCISPTECPFIITPSTAGAIDGSFNILCMGPR